MQNATSGQAPTNIVDVTTASFESEVVNAGIPVLVDFWAPWCGPCQQLAPVLAEVATHFGDALRIAKINVDEEPALASQFGVRGIPMLIVFANGKLVDQVTGLQSSAQLIELLQPHTGGAGDTVLLDAQQAADAGDHETAIALLQATLQQKPDDMDALIQLARVHMQLKQFEQAERRLAEIPLTASAAKVDAIKSELKLAQQAVDSGPIEDLQSAIRDNPDDTETRFELARAYVSAGDHVAAMEQFYELMLRDRSYRDDAGREGLLSIFDVLGSDHTDVRAYRRKLANFLN